MALADLDGAQRLAAIANTDTATSKDWFRLGDDYKFGKRTFAPRSEHQGWNYLSHDDGGSAPWNVESAGFTPGVKFGKGFTRRGADVIQHDAARKQHEASLEQRKETVASQRRALLEAQDKRNGFNVISGDFDPARNTAARPGKHIIGAKLSDFQKREGDVLMRVSASRFHRLPTLAEGEAPRVSTIVNEGLSHTVRKSAVLGVGRGEMRSYGVADNFAYSCYDPAYRVPSPPEAPGGRIGTVTRVQSASTLPSLSVSTGTGVGTPGDRNTVGTQPQVSPIYAKPPRDRHIGKDNSGSMSTPYLRPLSNTSGVSGRSSQISRSEQRRAAEIDAVRALS